MFYTPPDITAIIIYKTLTICKVYLILSSGITFSIYCYFQGIRNLITASYLYIGSTAIKKILSVLGVETI